MQEVSWMWTLIWIVLAIVIYGMLPEFLRKALVLLALILGALYFLGYI